MSFKTIIFLLYFVINNFGESISKEGEPYQNAMNKGIYIHKEQPYFIPTIDTPDFSLTNKEYFHFNPTGNLHITKSGVFNFKQKVENKSEAFFRICSKNGKCLGQITFCYLTNSLISPTNFCPFGQDGLQFQMTKNGIFHSNPKIGLVEWAGTSCAIFGYLNDTVIFGPSYTNFSLPSEKMEFQKLPGSKFNQFLASFNLRLSSNECSIEPINAFILLRTTSGATPPKDGENKEEEEEVESADLTFLLYIGAGIVALFDLILGILIIIAIILEKRKESKERKKELEERLKAQTAIIAFEAKKAEREKQRKERKEKLEKGLLKPLKHINTESEKLVIEIRPQKLYATKKDKLQQQNPQIDESSAKRKQKRRKRKNDADPATISEKLPSTKPIKKDSKNNISKRAVASSSQTSHISKIQPKQISSAISDKSNNVKN